MRVIWFLLQKEFRQIFRNPAIMRLIIVLPVMQLLILPLAANYEIKNINIAFVDHDHSSYSRQLISSITGSRYFVPVSYGNSYPEAFKKIENDEADLVLEIPPSFEKNLVRDGSQQLFVAVNAINGTKANLGGVYLLQIIRNFNENIIASLIHSEKPAGKLMTEPANWFNPLQSYKVFMVPGILAILVTLIGVILCALNIVVEKEKGTIEQINVTPVKKYQFILGKLIPFWIIGMFVFSIGLLGVARIAYGIIPAGNIFILYSFLAIYLIAVLGIGLTISAYSATQQQAMSVAFFFMMIFLLMSGLFTPVESMPAWAMLIAKLNPVTYFIEVMRMVVMKGSGFYELRPQLLIITTMAIVTNTMAVISYRKRN
jgi:ABC-2 type transport system permease protein